jgi:hypothetical protein
MAGEVVTGAAAITVVDIGAAVIGVGGVAAVIGANRSCLIRPVDERRSSPDRMDWHFSPLSTSFNNSRKASR